MKNEFAFNAKGTKNKKAFRITKDGRVCLIHYKGSDKPQTIPIEIVGVGDEKPQHITIKIVEAGDNQTVKMYKEMRKSKDYKRLVKQSCKRSV